MVRIVGWHAPSPGIRRSQARHHYELVAEGEDVRALEKGGHLVVILPRNGSRVDVAGGVVVFEEAADVVERLQRVGPGLEPGKASRAGARERALLFSPPNPDPTPT